MTGTNVHQAPAKHKRRHYTIVAGECIVTRGDVVLSTVLGSCIAVCLFAGNGKYCGMNHFMLPSVTRQYKDARSILHTNSGFYGINAMEILINELMKRGISKQSLVAKVFGGADVLPIMHTRKTVGRQNVEFITEYLDLEKIPLVACSTGGNFARKVLFFAQTGIVYHYRLGMQKSDKVIIEEAALYKNGSK